MLEKVSLQVGKLLNGKTGPHFRRPVAFKFCSVCLFVCLSPMQSESQVGARCRDSDKERTLTHRELPTCRCNAWQCNAMLPTCCCNAWHSKDDDDGDGDNDLDDDDNHGHDRDDVEAYDRQNEE